jgi:hypothetical protein
MRKADLDTVEVRPEVATSWGRKKDARLRRSVWNAGGCSSYYLNEHGINVAAWPGLMSHMVWKLRRFDMKNYSTKRAPSRQPDSARSGGDDRATQPAT